MSSSHFETVAFDPHMQIAFFALNRHSLCYFSIRVSVKASFELKYTQQIIIGMVKYTRTAKE